MCKVPEKMLAAFKVVFVKWVFLWSWVVLALEAHVLSGLCPPALEKDRGHLVGWHLHFLPDIRVAAAGSPVGGLALGAP